MIANYGGWILIWAFVLFLVAMTIGEAVWLARKGEAGFGKSFTFSFLTNLIGYTIGFFIFFFVLLISVAMTWDGLHHTEPPLGGYGDVILWVFSVLLCIVILALIKRLLLTLFKIQSGKAAWIYSAVASVLSFLVTLGIPGLMAYFMMNGVK